MENEKKVGKILGFFSRAAKKYPSTRDKKIGKNIGVKEITRKYIFPSSQLLLLTICIVLLF